MTLRQRQSLNRTSSQETAAGALKWGTLIIVAIVGIIAFCYAVGGQA